MTFILYGDLRSGAFSVEAALAEAGAPYEFKVISLEKNEQRAPEFLAINPSGKIPALRFPSGEVVTESAGLLLAIADLFPQAGLLPPSGTPVRAQAYRWLAFLASEIYPMVEITDYPERFVPSGEPAEALRKTARDRIRERFRIIEEAIAGPWFSPSGFSLVDIYAAMFSRWSIGKDWRNANLPKVCAIAKALSERPKAGPVWMRHYGEA